MSYRRHITLLLLAWVALAACKGSQPGPVAAMPAPRKGQVFHKDKLEEMDQAILQAIAAGKLPGGVLRLEHGGESRERALGRRAVLPADEVMTTDTIFDAASLTKVMATTPAIMLLVERGALAIDAPVKDFIPEFTGEGRDAVTIRQLLTHTSGLRPGIGGGDWSGYSTAVDKAVRELPRSAPGTSYTYSDINFILLGEIVQRVSSRRLDQFCEHELYKPLRMDDTGFCPSAERISRVAPTTLEAGKIIRGVVHDPTARKMGGVSGHAGLFTTAADTARYAHMLLGEGELDGVRIFRPETVRLMTSWQSPPGVAARRGLGWDIDSNPAGPRGQHFPIGSFGHTGWTGTLLWVDPFSQTILVFHSNRNHPSEAGSVQALRAQLGTLAAEAIADFNFQHVPGALPPRVLESGPVSARVVLNGIDVLERDGFATLAGLKVGLVTNHTGHNRQRKPTIDLLKAAPGVQLLALFSPEHGIRGELDEKIPDGIDLPTGLVVHSLYGERRGPAPEQLEALDALVFDIQDIGCRFYTYVATMANCMEACARARKKFIVLDRVNPIGGQFMEGPVHSGSPTFTAWHSVPLRHGMTVGELARMINSERGLGAELVVVRVEGWERSLWFDETGLPWTNTSPNMRSTAAALLYPGVGLLESAVSVGRGTDTPFELVGAPYLDDVHLAAEMNRLGLAGVRFVPVRFTPRASTFKNLSCRGVSIVVTDRERFNSVITGVALILVLQRLHPGEFAINKVEPLLQHPATLEAVKAGKSLVEIVESWSPELEAFRNRREAFLLYR